MARPRKPKQEKETTPVIPIEAPTSRHIWQVLCFLISLVLYWASMYPSLPPGDAGELILAAHQLGVAHAPGYPLFTLLGHAASTLLPWGTVAYRVNLMCVVCGAGASSMLAATVIESTGQGWVGLFAGLLFALSPNVWLYSVQAEVFAVNNLLVCSLLYLTVLYCNTRRDWVAFAGAAVIGLGMTNQHTIVLFGIPLAAMVFYTGKTTLATPARLCGLILAALSCFVPPYLWMGISGRVPVKYGWGDVSSFSGLVSHMLRREYGTFQLAESTIGTTKSQFLPRLWAYFSTEVSEITPVGVVLALYGMCQRRSLHSHWFLWTLGLYTIIFNWLANLPLDPLHLGVQARFWLQPHAIVCCFAAVGASEVEKRTKTRVHPGMVVLAVTALLAAMRWGESCQSHNNVLTEYVTHALNSLPPQSLIFTSGDNLVNGVAYLQQVERLRPDVVALPLQWVMGHKWFAHQRHFFDIEWPKSRPGKRPGLKSLIEANWGKFKGQLFVYGFHPSDDLFDAEEEFVRLPHGLTCRILGARSKMDLSRWEDTNFGLLPRFEIGQYPESTWEAGLAQDCLMANYTHARFAVLHHRSLMQRKPRPSHILKPFQLKRVYALIKEVHAKVQIHPPPGMLEHVAEIGLTQAEAAVEVARISDSKTKMVLYPEALASYRAYLVAEKRVTPEAQALKDDAHHMIHTIMVTLRSLEEPGR